MAGSENLKPLTPERARELGAKGGKASGASRRKRKTLQEMTKQLAALPLSDIGLASVKRSGVDVSGIDEDDLTALAAVILGQIRAASKGDARAAAVVAEWLDLPNKNKKTRLEIEKLKAEIEKLRGGYSPEDDDNVLRFIKSIKE